MVQPLEYVYPYIYISFDMLDQEALKDISDEKPNHLRCRNIKLLFSMATALLHQFTHLESRLNLRFENRINLKKYEISSYQIVQND